ncbi:MAG TPA: hypothetical protein PK228_13060 [Saprospiraceae bacterium]|nr:hypothetical protein [Saprospiraceae bacterium]
MTQSKTILDTPLPPPSGDKPAYKWLRRIAVAIEIGLWLIGAFAFLFKFESWEGGSEMIILAFTMLASFYFLLTFLVTGARGRQQILGAFGVGISISLFLIGGIFTAESWPGGREMLYTGLILSVIAAITTFIFSISASRNGEKTSFHWNVLVRLGIILLILR